MRPKKKFSYSPKTFQNPYFRGSRRKPSFNIRLPLKAKMAGAGMILLLLCAGWLFYFSPLFAIKDVEINGIVRVAPEVIRAEVEEQFARKRFLIIPQKNINIFDSEALNNRLSGKYELEYLNIEKKWPGKIIINLEEKQYVAIWQEDGRFYFLDKDGRTVSEINADDVNAKNYPLVENLTPKKIANNYIAFDKKYIEAAVSISQQIRKYKDYKIEKFAIDPGKEETIILKIEFGPEIYFSLQADINSQLTKLFILIDEKLKQNFLNHKYIELRFGDRVFYQ